MVSFTDSYWSICCSFCTVSRIQFAGIVLYFFLVFLVTIFFLKGNGKCIYLYFCGWLIQHFVPCLSSSQERESVYEQLTVLRQLQSFLDVQKFARNGQYSDALREISKLSFLPLDPRTPNPATDIFHNLSPHVQACVPDLLKLALNISDHVKDSDGTVRGLRSKVCLLNILLYY